MSLERLEITPLLAILEEIITDKKTGFLTIMDGHARRNLYWSLGELVMVTSDSPEDSLADLLVRRQMIGPEEGRALAERNPVELVLHFHELELAAPASRQSLLREWVGSVVTPLFSLESGTTTFTDDEALDPDQRIFLSTSAVILEGVRSITNGLILRRSLGDLKREIGPANEPRYSVDRLPLEEGERKIAESLQEPKTVENFLKDFPGDSLTAARVVIAMSALGVFEGVQQTRRSEGLVDEDQTQKDMQLLATLGSGDPKSLQAVALARQLPQMDLYHFLDLPRAAIRGQIISRGEEMRRKYDVASYPALVREYIQIIGRKIDEAVHVLGDPGRRVEYDKMLSSARRDDGASVQQRMTRRSIAEQNFRRGRELSIQGDYWGAIVLLRQAVEYAPDNSDAWYILGSCLEQNPKWIREAVEAYQRVLSIDPNSVEALLSLGDLYRRQGLASRAIGCYEEALQIEPENVTAKSRIKNIGKRK
ncbi:MAG TPA: tetratricopeptide repeat protein [Thermoanaerobaculia bacterium]|nr:tetratricopeptide repeat protein [Thermoanaerobaculia bacterium]